MVAVAGAEGLLHLAVVVVVVIVVAVSRTDATCNVASLVRPSLMGEMGS